MKNWLIVIFLFYSVSCCKSNQSVIPNCISSLINIQKDEIREVYSYTFQEKIVYEFIPKEICCDFPYTIYSDNCNILCTLYGITGNQICVGDSFYLKATDKELVWKK